MLHRLFSSHCPSWLVGLFDNPLRKWIHDPVRLLAPYVRPGMTVLDIGCGAGYFSLGLAKLAGEKGRVISLDIQAAMLKKVKRRAERLGYEGVITAVQVGENDLGAEPPADFALAFWMVHEVRDRRRFFTEVRSRLRPGGKLLVAEPRVHVTKRAFEAEVTAAEASGWTRAAEPQVALSRAVLLQ